MLVVAQYVIILSVCACAGGKFNDGNTHVTVSALTGAEHIHLGWRYWTDGSIPKIIANICGSWMGGALLAASMVGN